MCKTRKKYLVQLTPPSTQYILGRYQNVKPIFFVKFKMNPNLILRVKKIVLIVI